MNPPRLSLTQWVRKHVWMVILTSIIAGATLASGIKVEVFRDLYQQNTTKDILIDSLSKAMHVIDRIVDHGIENLGKTYPKETPLAILAEIKGITVPAQGLAEQAGYRVGP